MRVETPGPDGQPDWTQSYFDGLGRTYRTVKRGPSVNESIVTDVQFNERGGIDQQKAPYYANGTPKITSFDYDYFDRLTVTTLPDGKMRTNAFPALSADGFFQTTQTNELNQSTTTKFDVLGRTRKSEKVTTGFGALVTTRNYDVLGRMTSLVDPAGNTWTYTYDSLNRNLTKNDPDAGNWTYAYDDAGRVTAQVDAKGQATTFEYDSVGRLQYRKIRPTGGVGGTVTEYVETAYGTSAASFNKGRVIQLTTRNGAGIEQNGKLAFAYDALGRVTSQTRTIDGVNYSVQKNFDAAGYLRGMQYPDGDILGAFGGSGTALGYDEAGRLSSIPGILTSVTYNALGAPLVQMNANGTTTTKTYDPNRFWLKTIGTTAPSLTLQNLSYTLNDAGMATEVTSPFGTEGWTYGYDELNRLTSSTNTGASTNNQTWTYDSLGRITNNSRVGNYTYGSSRPHAVTAAGSNTYTSYDNNGNLLLGGGRSLTWDANNMVTQVVMGGNTTTFTYGPDGDRIKKTSSSTTLRYPFGDDYEINGSTVTKYFNAGFGVIAKKVGTTLYWLHTDRMGSINATTDGSGFEVLRRSYRSYGELLGQTGTNTESLGYIGQRTDSETGLTYLHARYYDSSLGMFLSPDPVGADPNTYRYAGGDPANFSDPSGLLKDPCDGDAACIEWYYRPSDPVMGMSMGDFQGAMGTYVGMLGLMGFSGDIVEAAAAHEQGVDARLVELAQQRMAEEAFAGEQATRTDGVQVASLETPVSVDGKLYNMGVDGTKVDQDVHAAGNRALAATALAFTGGLIVGPSVYGAYSGAQIAAMAAALNKISQGTSYKDAVSELNRIGASQSQAVAAIARIAANKAQGFTQVAGQHGATIMASQMEGIRRPVVHIAANGNSTFTFATISINNGVMTVTDILNVGGAESDVGVTGTRVRAWPVESDAGSVSDIVGWGRGNRCAFHLRTSGEP